MLGHNRSVIPLLFGSGFCALIYQTTWLREFRLIFGASTAASAAVIGVFMAGLGFGGIVLGRRSERQAQPLAFYAKLELLIAISAAVSPVLIFVARHAYIALGGTGTLGLFFGTVFRLILAALIMGAPTFLMGGTLPAVARAVVGPTDLERRSVGALYGFNTLGAVVGAAVGTFFCFENLGNRLTLWLAAVLNIGIALAAFQLAKRSVDVKSGPASVSKLLPEGKATLVSPKFVLVAAGIVGFAFFLMELVWYRMLAPLLGGSTFSFALILAVALLGIGIGGIAYALFGLERSASAMFFAITCAGEAFFVALPYALGDRIAMAAMLLRPLGALGFYGHVIAWTALCSIVVLPPAFISGLQFPLLIALLGKGRKLIGSQTGAAYAWNTIGALAGSLAGGFGFIPRFSAPGVWRMVIVLLCALSLAAALLASRERGRWRAMFAPVITLFALSMLWAAGPTAFWRHSQIGTGHVTQFQGSANEMRELMQKFRRETIWEADGIESVVALSSGDGLAFIVNGRADGNAKRDAGTQVMLGLIGAALHPSPTNALVVGLGTGSTAGWLAAVPSITKVDVVELEPAVLAVAKQCAAVNHNALLNPKLHVTIGDAREVLLTTGEKYDLVVSEPSNPYRAGIAGLFTKEYYQSVHRCLRPDGIFLQWVQAYDIDDATMQVIYRTLGSVFSNVETWQSARGDIALMGSHSAVRYSVEILRNRLGQEPFKSALLAAWQAPGLEDFLGHYVANNALAETLRHLGSPALNTDDRTVIEFSLARSQSAGNGFQIATARGSAHEAQVDRPMKIDGDVDWSAVDESRLSMFGPLSRAEQNQTAWTPSQRARAGSFASYSDGDLAAALRNWRSQEAEPKTLSQSLMLAECLAEQGDSGAATYIDKIRESLPWEADAIQAELSWRQRKPEEAVEILQRLLRALSDDPWPNHELISRSLTRAESLARSDRSGVVADFFYDALSKPFSVFNNESDRLAARLSLAIYVDRGQPAEKTRAAITDYEPNVVWRRQFLQLRKDCYNALNDPRAEQARRDLDEFDRHDSTSNDVSTLTKEIEARSATGTRY